MVPLPQLLAEVIMALGGALFAANAWALLRPRLRPGDQATPHPRARGRIVANIFIGLVVLVWGFASLIARS